MARKFDAPADVGRADPTCGCEETLRGIYGERRCGDMIESRESGKGLCHAHHRNWLAFQADVRRTQASAERYLTERGVVRKGMTPAERMAALREMRQRVRGQKAEVSDPIEWARLIVSRVADGETLPMAVEEAARQAVEECDAATR